MLENYSSIRERAIEVNRPTLDRLRRSLFRAEGIDDEEHDGDANARVCNVEGRPGMREWDVQIEEQKIDHVSVEKTVG